MAPGWEITARGLVVSNSFTAGAARPLPGGMEEVSFLEGSYASNEDRVRVRIRTSAPGYNETRTLFLQPVEPLPAAAP